MAMMRSSDLSDDALAILQAVSERPLEGYEIMGRTRLNSTQLEASVKALERAHLVSVRRPASVRDIGQAVVYVLPTARNEVNQCIGRVPS